jgi:hypothetical protein
MADGTVVNVTCSVGLAQHPRDGRSGKALLRAADAAMYTHKRARAGTGRGAYRRSQDLPVPPSGADAEDLSPVAMESTGRD